MEPNTAITSASFTSTPDAIAGPPSNPSSKGWSREQATEKAVNQLMVQKFTEIVASYDQRKQATSVQDLATGPWYPNDYAQALRKHRQQGRLDWLKARDAFFHGFPPTGFIAEPNPAFITKIGPCSYQIKPDCQPSQALVNIKTGQPSMIDCQGAVELAMYETLKEVFGEERFNEIFSAQGKTPLQLHPVIQKTHLYALGFVKEARLDVRAIAPNLGDNVYFSNIPLYTRKHRNAEAKGFHAVCISPSDVANKRYIAFGTAANGKTESEMHDMMIDEFNAKPINPSSIFRQQLATYFHIESVQVEREFAAVTGRDIADYTIDRAQFEYTVQQSNHEQAGLTPVVKRLDIPTIHQYLPN
jgi:hypothetical protein